MNGVTSLYNIVSYVKGLSVASRNLINILHILHIKLFESMLKTFIYRRGDVL